MIVTEIRCEFCTRAEEAEGSKQRGWGQITSVGAGTRDVCPTCIAKMSGWHVAELRRLERHSA